MTHIFVDNQTIISSNNGLPPGRVGWGWVQNHPNHRLSRQQQQIPMLTMLPVSEKRMKPVNLQSPWTNLVNPTVHRTNIPKCTILYQKCAYICIHSCYKMVHCEIWDWCIVGFVQHGYWSTCRFAIKTFENCFKTNSITESCHQDWRSQNW